MTCIGETGFILKAENQVVPHIGAKALNTTGLVPLVQDYVPKCSKHVQSILWALGQGTLLCSLRSIRFCGCLRG